MPAVRPVLILCCLVSAAGLSAQDSALSYTEVHGQQASTVEYRVSRAGGEASLSSTGGSTETTIRWQPSIGTFDWQMTDLKAGSVLHGVRIGNVIHVTGALKNKKVERDVKVDPAPWYQVFGPLLQDLLPEASPQTDFWVVNPDDLSAHKMQVKRAGSERITIRGAAMDTFKIHFSPAGALAPFWGADFWYRASDGVYVSSRLPENGGMTVTTIEDANQ
jgi:hypothetical protein